MRIDLNRSSRFLKRSSTYLINMSTSILHTPIRLGALELPNRFIMAPLTRCRSDEGRVPNALMAQYYAQRAGAGLIIAEATSISPQGVGYPRTPGIWSEAQVEGWKLVTDAVHEAGGRIMLQLWHVGRISDPVYLDGELPVAPSAIAPEGHVSLVRPEKGYETPRALETAELAGIIADYRRGAENAKAAGFDGVEIHGANGYLLDQFLQDSSNQREDRYGGSLENRARLMLEVVDAVSEVWGTDRVGLHLSPRCDAHDMGDSDPKRTFGYIAEQCGQRGLAFLCTREGVVPPDRDADDFHGDWAKLDRDEQLALLKEERLSPYLKKVFGGPLLANMNLTSAIATAMIEHGEADAGVWGRQFIANPDLPERIRQGADLNEPEPETFYHGGADWDPARGYVDYPRLETQAAL